MIFRNAIEMDIGAIANLHIKAFPNFFLSKLGCGFLIELYRGFLAHPDSIFLVAESDDGQLFGFVVGTIAPDRLFSDLRRRRALFFLMHALPALFKSPALVFTKLYSALRYRGDSPSALYEGALLSSIGVLPNQAGKAIGKSLLLKFESVAFTTGVPFIYLTTDEINNQRANIFYSKNGYVIESKFMQGNNRPMLRYLKNNENYIGVCNEL